MAKHSGHGAAGQSPLAPPGQPSGGPDPGLLDLLSDSALLLHATTLEVVHANPPAVACSGYLLDEIRGMALSQLCQPCPAVLPPLGSSFTSPCFDSHQLCKGGAERPVQVRLCRWPGADGAGYLVAVLGAPPAAGGSRNAEEVARLFSSALQLAKAGVWEYDVGQDEFLFDDNLYRIFGTSAAEVGGYRMGAGEYA